MTRQITVTLLAVLFLCSLASAKTNDPGYFLSWQQKKDLLCLGRIQDSAGTWYDVWICTGYIPPSCYAWKYLKKSGSDFHEYVETNKYHSLKENSMACFKWAFKECGLGFTVKGIPNAWDRHFTLAHARTQRRVFGWWLAYPWAFMESTVETAFRGVVGSVGTAGGAVSGVAVVPLYHTLDSAVVGVWDFGVNTIVVPAVGLTWNTVVSPPLALVGQKPAESRVDGFWVTIVGSGREPGTHILSQEEVRLLSQWGLLLLRETQPFAQKQAQIDRDEAEKEKQLRREIQTAQDEAKQKRTELQKEKNERIQQAVATNELSSALSSRQSALVYAGNYEKDIRRYLAGQNVSSGDIEKILNLLRAYSSPCSMIPSQTRDKTDPLRRSVDIIGESAKDALE